MIKNNFNSFKDREGRAQFIKEIFNTQIKNSTNILDVGCSDNELKKIVGKNVYGIDISGSPDEFIDLEKESLKKFADNSYDFVVCTEVLEHIDNFYEVLNDLFRISKKNILISLPNCPDIWKVLRIIITSKTGKFYGLPIEKPTDRHKWFFSWKELDNFFSLYCKKNNLQIKLRFVHFNYLNSIKGIILKTLLKIFPLKSFAQSYWILIEKK